MVEWSRGYTTNTDYTYGFYRDLAPSHINLLCRLQGLVEPEGPLTCLELGCGQGLGPNLLAASNPNDTFIGVDFSPEHVVGARQLAAKAELRNVFFLEKSFEALAHRTDVLPECDVISLHGIYSWIGPDQRQAIKTIISEKLKTGGVVYISYNCSAGWAPLSNFQRIFRDLALSRGGGFSQTSATLYRLKALRDADFGFFKQSPALNKLLDDAMKNNLNYIDHEYMHDHWTPFHFQTIAREMRECKLTFVGSSNPADNSENLSLPPDLAKLVREEPDPDLRESLKDLEVGRRFRKDIYIKGAVRLSVAQRDARLRDTVFALVTPRDDVKDVVNVPRGQMKLGKPIYAQALDLLNNGPTSLSAVAPTASDLHELLTVLVQMGVIHPIANADSDTAAALRINKVMSSEPTTLARYGYFASSILGTAIGINCRLAPAFAATLRGELMESDLDNEIDRLRSNPIYGMFFSEQPNNPLAPENTAAAFRAHRPLWSTLGLLQAA